MPTDERFILGWPGRNIPGPPSSLLATDGGQGSFSYVDTSVYGLRQFHGAYIAQRPYIKYPEVVLVTAQVPTSFPLRAGGGGGARVPGNRKFGSRAVGYSPHGVVLLRLYR